MAESPAQSAHQGRHRSPSFLPSPPPPLPPTPRPRRRPLTMLTVDVRLVQIHPLKPDARIADRVRRFTLDDFTTDRILGRASKNRFLNPAATNLWIESPIVTKEHARFFRGPSVNEPLFIRDLKSTHGTFVAGVKITSDCAVADGDIVQFGDRISNGPILFEPPSFLVEYDVHPSGRPPTPSSSSPAPVMPRDNPNTFRVPDPDSDVELEHADSHASQKGEPSYSCPEYESDYTSDSEDEQDRTSLSPPRHHPFFSDHPLSDGEDQTSSDEGDEDAMEPTRTAAEQSSLLRRSIYLPNEPVHQRSYRHTSSARSSSVDSEDVQDLEEEKRRQFTPPRAVPKPNDPTAHIPSAISDKPDLGSSPRHPIVVDGGDPQMQSSEHNREASPAQSSVGGSRAYRPRSPIVVTSYSERIAGPEILGHEGLASPSVLSNQAQAGTPRPSSPSDAAMVKPAPHWFTFPPRVPDSPQLASDLWATDEQTSFVHAVDSIPVSADPTTPIPDPMSQSMFAASYETTRSGYSDGPFKKPELAKSKPSRSSLPLEELMNPAMTTSSRKRTADTARLDVNDILNEPKTDTRALPPWRQAWLQNSGKAVRPYKQLNTDTTFSEPVAVVESEEPTFNLDDIFTEHEVDEDDLDEDNFSDDLNVNDFGFYDVFDARNADSGPPPSFAPLVSSKPALLTPDTEPNMEPSMTSPLDTTSTHVESQQPGPTSTTKHITTGETDLEVTSKQNPHAAVKEADVESPIQTVVDAPRPTKKVKLSHTPDHRTPRFSRFMNKAVPFMAGAAATAATIFAGAGMLISTMHDELRKEAMLDLGFANV